MHRGQMNEPASFMDAVVVVVRRQRHEMFYSSRCSAEGELAAPMRFYSGANIIARNRIALFNWTAARR